MQGLVEIVYPRKKWNIKSHDECETCRGCFGFTHAQYYFYLSFGCVEKMTLCNDCVLSRKAQYLICLVEAFFALLRFTFRLLESIFAFCLVSIMLLIITEKFLPDVFKIFLLLLLLLYLLCYVVFGE